MKRKFFMLALAGFVAFSFVGTSCGDDDDDETPVNNNKPAEENKDNKDNKDNNTDKPADNTDKPAENTKNHFIVVDVPAMEANPWDSQFWIYLPDGVAEGDDIEISMKVKADVETPQTGDNPVFGLQWHAEPSDYAGNLTVGMNFTTEWQTITLKETVGEVPEKGYKSITWNLNNFADANKYYFDDISVKVGGQEKVKNGNMEGTDFSSFYKKELNTDTNPVVVPVIASDLSVTGSSN